MKLTVLNSGSRGNSYILEASDGILLLECGVSFNDLKAALKFKLDNVVGCLLSHEHKDHSSEVPKLIRYGINIYSSKGTIGALKVRNHRLIPIEAKKRFKLGSYTILPFDVKHDAAEPLGFIINHPESGNILFITDSNYVNYKFKDLNNILIEANYSKEILDRRGYNNDILQFLSGRIQRSHLSLETCIEVLKGNDLTKVNNIVLLHLSDGNSDSRVFKARVEEETAKTVYIADKGLKIDLNLTPF